MQSRNNQQIDRMDEQSSRVELLAHEILRGNHVQLQTKYLELHEDFVLGKADVKATILHKQGSEEKSIHVEGQGVGLVDALFDAMMKAFSKEHLSLAKISIVDFNISIKMRGTDGRKTDAFAIATLRVRTSDNYEYAFSHRTSSISRSSANVVADVFAFFINSERAYTQLYLALNDAKKRGRSDLAERYQNQMATLVHATSYGDIVEKLKGH